MMKKYTAIALMLAAALTLSACGRNDNVQPENGGGTPSQNAAENAPEESEENSGENNEQPSEAEIPEDVQKVIDMFDTDSFTAPDGSEVMLTEAASQINDFALRFDFAYLRYAFPIYKDTVTNPEIYDFDNFEFTVDNYTMEVPEYFRVKKGDVLDNGMTVTEANYILASYDPNRPFENSVELEGECTMEGVLYRCPEDEYMTAQDDVYFYPNPVNSIIPDPYAPHVVDMGEVVLATPVDLFSEFAFVSDGGSFCLGNVNDMDSYVKDLFGDNTYVKVRVTLDGIQLRYSDNFGTQGWSTLKNAEILDS